MCNSWALLKVAATSLKLEIRLHAHQVDTNTQSGTKVTLRSSDWLMRSELGYFAHSLISGVNRQCSNFKGLQITRMKKNPV